ncbi:MAG: arylsulfotransferase family protein, partial [Actinomycetota bacterium]|nr:arylsulfotransferase family protein [Actinomycetota bacterium]
MSGLRSGAWTCGTLAVAAAALAAWLAPGAVAHADGPSAKASRTLWYEWFRSRPDLRPPKVRVGTTASGVAPGYVFLAAIPAVHPTAHRGPMIVDNEGRLVWFKRLPQGVAPADLRVQTYRGQPVVTWWQGRFIPGGFGCGVGVIADTSYRTIATVRPTDQGRYCPDLHELKLTPRGTALMMFYRRARVNGRTLLDNIIEEVDVATGRVLFRWSAARHVPIGESYVTAYKDRSRPYDYFHANSVDQDADGNFLISARHTWAVYKLDRNGKIVWRLGGKRSDFRVPADARFGWQHDARFQPDGTISLLDNAARRGRFLVRRNSTAFVFRLDEARRTLSVVRKYVHPDRLLARSQANFQILPNRNAFVGWGEAPAVSEFSPGGRLLFDLRLPPAAGSYRAYRFRWTGRPAEAPRVAAVRSPRGGVAVFMSWNGST